MLLDFVADRVRRGLTSWTAKEGTGVLLCVRLVGRGEVGVAVPESKLAEAEAAA